MGDVYLDYWYSDPERQAKVKDEFEMPVKAERKFMHFWNESMENKKNYDVLKMIDNYHLMLLGAFSTLKTGVFTLNVRVLVI